MLLREMSYARIYDLEIAFKYNCTCTDKIEGFLQLHHFEERLSFS